MNKAILLGRLTKDPEIRYSQSADPICVSRFTLAVDRRFKKDGEPDADFIFCVAFRKTAEFMERYIKKGMAISVCGSIQVRNYEDSQGQRRTTTEVVCDEVNFAESRAAYEARMARAESGYSSRYNAPPSAPPTPPPASPPQQSQPPDSFRSVHQSIDDDDDLPF